MKIIVLHDYFESLEGGGRLSHLLAEGLKTDLGYGFASLNHPFTQINHSTWNLHAGSRLPLWRQYQLARAFAQRTAFLKDYDTVIYSGFYAPLAVTHHRQGQNVLYCHTPPRFIYDQRDFYLHQLPRWLRPVLHAFIQYLQPRYEEAVDNMDIIIANSETVRQRIAYYLNKEAVVIHPPCDTTQFTWQGQDNYYLSIARLDPLKQVDKIVAAFLTMPDKPLVIASGGAELPRLRKLAGKAKHIRFTGWVSDDTLVQLIGRAIATIYLPVAEDFGMSPVESMAAGKPVIGIAEGGLLETIISGETGILLESPVSVEKIRTAVQTMTPSFALTMRTACEKRAQYFRLEKFLSNITNLL